MRLAVPARSGTSWSRGRTCAHLGLALLFGYSVVVQHNDHDALRWMAVYGAAAGLQVAAMLRRVPMALVVPFALVAAGWGLSLAPQVMAKAESAAGVWEGSRMLDVLLDAEEGREMLGLLLVAAATASLVPLRGPRSRGAPASEEVAS